MVKFQMNISSSSGISTIVTLSWGYHHLHLYNLLPKIVPSSVTEDGTFWPRRGQHMPGDETEYLEWKPCRHEKTCRCMETVCGYF